jgi:sortase A
VRRLGWLLVLMSIATAGYAGLIVWRGDPVTAIYAGIEQTHLRNQLREQATHERERRGRAVPEGSAFAVIEIPRIGVDAAVVQGTSAADLAQGPGHYRMTGVPGSGRVIAIAGHRTTFGAWFRHVDDLRAGDPIYLAYHGRRYLFRVTGHRVVQPSDWTILRYRGYEELVLSTCNPVYSAAQRWIVFARRVTARADQSAPLFAPWYRRFAI